MAIPEGWIQENTSIRNNISQRAAEQVKDMLTSYMTTHSNATEENIRTFAFESIKSVLETQGEAAGAIARDNFVVTMEKAGKSVDAQLYGYSDVIDESYIRGHIYKSYRNNFDGTISNVQQFIRAMGDTASSGVNRMHMMNTKLNAKANQTRYARIPTGSKTCAWCMMLASRGAVYYSEDSAKRANHSNCDCIFMAMPAGQYVEGWDGKSFERMQNTMEICGIDKYTPIDELTTEQWKRLNALVTLQNVEYYKNGKLGVYGETKTYTDWVNTLKGKELQDYIRRHANEITSAELLRRIGVDTIFARDEKIGIDGLTKGLADLSNKIELKTTEGMASKRAIKNAFINYQKKDGEKKLLFFDFRSVGNYGFEEETKERIQRSIRKQMNMRDVNQVMVYYPDGQYEVL